MTRAKMAELMAEQIYPTMAEPAFTAGLVSALDLLLSMPLAEVLKNVSLTVDLEDALLGNRGLLGSIIWDVLEWETGGVGPPAGDRDDRCSRGLPARAGVVHRCLRGAGRRRPGCRPPLTLGRHQALDSGW